MSPKSNAHLKPRIPYFFSCNKLDPAAKSFMRSYPSNAFFRSKHYQEYKLCKYLLYGKRSCLASAMPMSAFCIEESLPRTEGTLDWPDVHRRSSSTTDASINSWPLVRDNLRGIYSPATSLPTMPYEQVRARSAGAVDVKGMGCVIILYSL